MKSSVKLRPSPWDALAAAVIAAAAIALGVILLGRAGTGGSLTCTVAQDGKTLKTVVLSEIPAGKTETFAVSGDYDAVVELERDRVRVQSSTCPTQDCVHTGWISKAGQSIVCLPGRLTVTLSGGTSSGSSSSGVDAVLGQEGQT